MSNELGPVEFLVVVFEGNKFKGEIIPSLNALTDAGLVRIIDLAVIIKNAVGDVMIYESSELQGEVAEAFAQWDGELTGLLSEEDLRIAAEELDNNSTAAAMLFENVWAKQFAQAVRNAGGEVLLNMRVPHDVVVEEQRTLIEAMQSS